MTDVETMLNTRVEGILFVLKIYYQMYEIAFQKKKKKFNINYFNIELKRKEIFFEKKDLISASQTTTHTKRFGW